VSTASGYGRQSQGSDRSIDQQHDSYIARCASEGWDAGPWLSDRVSASRYATKMRDDWPLLMRRLPDLDVVWLWESSRGSRLLSEWALFLEACQEYRVKIYIETHARLYDPRNGRDEKQLNEDGVDSVYESSKVSARVTRDNLDAAQNGKPHGWVAYGYKRLYEGEGAKRKMTGQVPDPDAAPVVREIYARLRAGESLRRIANALNERGISSSRGGRWDERKIRQLVLSPQYTALRIHAPVAGGVRARTIGNGVKLTEGDWERLVDRETFYRVHALLTDPARKTTKPGRARHLLSRIGRCGVCGGYLTCIDRKTRRRNSTGHMKNTGQREGCYQCADKGCARIAEADLDRFATGVIIRWLSCPENYAAFTKNDSAELATVRADLAEQRAREDEIAAALRDGSLSVAVGSKASQGLEGTIRALEARERDLSTPSILADLIPPGADVASGWALATLEARRELCRMVFTPERAGTLVLGKRESRKLSAATRVRFDQERLAAAL
jgi:site-specific DNA recombinase